MKKAVFFVALIGFVSRTAWGAGSHKDHHAGQSYCGSRLAGGRHLDRGRNEGGARNVAH